GHPGSPVEDLTNIKPHVDRYADWGRFYQHYLAHGGPAVDLSDQALRYYACLANTIYSAAARRLAWQIGQYDVRDAASVYGANSYGFRFHQLALSGALGMDGDSPHSVHS